MFDPKRAARVDLKKKRFREEDKSVRRNLRNWEDEVDNLEKDKKDYRNYNE